MTIHVFTCAASNYMPKVRVLWDSVRRFHPDWETHLALADTHISNDAASDIAVGKVHLMEELEIPRWKAWAFGHSLVELASAIKPFLLRRLLAMDNCDAVIYLDPDIAVFSRLDDVEDALNTADIVLTPHQAEPEDSLIGIIANEICTLQHGIYNLGFIGVASRPEGRSFADWWAKRTYYFCREDISNGIYTDQRWIDLAASFFDGVSVLRTPRLNVAPWNLSRRRLEGSVPDALMVDDQPLGFFHFSAIDGSTEFESDGNALAKLVEWYLSESKPRQSEYASLHPWGFACFDDGEPISSEQRLVFRLRGDLQDAFPNPYASGAASFQDWWRTQAKIGFPCLFDFDKRAAEMQKLRSALTTGYLELEF